MYHRKMVAGIMIVFHTMGFAGHSCRGRSTFLWTSYHYLQCESWCDYTTTDLYNWSTISHRILPNTRAILLIFFNNVHTTNSQRLRSLWLPVCVCCNFPRRFGRGKKKKKNLSPALLYVFQRQRSSFEKKYFHAYVEIYLVPSRDFSRPFWETTNFLKTPNFQVAVDLGTR